MDDIFELMNWAYARTKDVKQEHVTYDDDSQADHDDGQYIGRKTAYNEIIAKCAELISANASRL